MPAWIRYRWRQPPAEMRAGVCNVVPTSRQCSRRQGGVAPSLRQRVGGQAATLAACQDVISSPLWSACCAQMLSPAVNTRR